MDLKQLTYFLCVAELGSFTRAEQRLSIAQSALSRQIRALEQEFQSRLFVRNGRGVVLTDAGKKLFAHAEAIVAQADRARLEVGGAGPLSGACRAGLPPNLSNFLTVALAERVRDELPDARLILYEMPSSTIVEWVEHGRLDFGFAHGVTGAPSYTAERIASERLYLIGPRNAGTPDTSPIAVAELKSFPLVVSSARPLGDRLFESSDLGDKLHTNVVWEVGSVKAVLDMVEAGLGYAIQPLFALQERRDAFVARPLVEPEITIALSAVVATHRPITRLAARVKEIAIALTLRTYGRGRGLRP